MQHEYLQVPKTTKETTFSFTTAFSTAFSSRLRSVRLNKLGILSITTEVCSIQGLVMLSNSGASPWGQEKGKADKKQHGVLLGRKVQCAQV